MTSEERISERAAKYHGSSSDAVYGLGFIGALVYFVGHTRSFWMGVLGVLKAIVWPAFLVYQAFEVLLQ